MSASANTRELKNRKGQTVQTPFTDEEAIVFLKENRVDKSFNQFAYELWAKSKGSKGLSPEQWFWVHKLCVDAMTPEPVGTGTQIDTEGVLRLFETAKSNGLQFPKIRLQTPDGTPVVLSISGERAKVPGAVNITNGAEFGSPSNKWFGRIKPDGDFQGSRSTTPEVLALVEALGNDAAKTVTEYGKLTGCCSICGRGLENQESIDRGIGPVCAKRIGVI